MARIELAPEVLDDFDRVLDHLSASHVDHLAQRIGEVVDALQILAHSPLIGRPVKGGKGELVIGPDPTAALRSTDSCRRSMSSSCWHSAASERAGSSALVEAGADGTVYASAAAGHRVSVHRGADPTATGTRVATRDRPSRPKDAAMISDPDAPQPPPANDDDIPSDSEHTIDLADDSAARHWANRLGVTIEQLHEAVQAAGPHVRDVTEHLLNQGGSAGAS